ncbi:nuclear transport factor 2 family protein [Actinoplanes solisilvae]|uniref:nuclear transport factor 2 family protein n=1 Tax=Actinoplanes solisilvae TaxID=2486853 RepID=UPI000FDB3F03|nr:nuclear transport factor 2 family protein [Actinoplanes solisilvae]
MPSKVDEFLTEMLPRQIEAERALCRGDNSARTATWSQNDPVTLFGAAVPVRQGWASVDQTFQWLAGQFEGKPLLSYDLELIAAGASGDLAYTVAFEHKSFEIDGQPEKCTLRVTHLYRREAGEWRIVHRHGDYPPS